MAINKKRNLKDKMANLANSRWSKKRKNDELDGLDENYNDLEMDFNNLSIIEDEGTKRFLGIQCEVSKRDFETQTSYYVKKQLWTKYIDKAKMFILLANLLTILRS